MKQPSLRSDFASRALDEKPFVDKSPAITHRLIDCTFEAHSLGDGARALARGRLIEFEPDLFGVVPTYLKEVCGPHVQWQSPAPGRAIQTCSPIVSFDQAHDVLAWWATKTLALNRKL